MDYTKLSKDELISKIEELEILTKTLLEDQEKDVKKNSAWSGNLGQWYWNIATNHVTFNTLKATNLGYKKDELPEYVPYQFFTDKLHPDDYEPTMQAMRDHLSGKTPAYEVEYRIMHVDGEYRWYYDRGVISKRTKEGKPLFLSGIVFDITESKKRQEDLKKSNEKLSKQSITDFLTKINNHRALIEHLNKTIRNNNISKTPLSIAMIDIDDFKKVNDEHGHVFGDKVLKKIADIIKEDLRDSDVVGRYGGEEFLVIYPFTSLESAQKVTDRFRAKIEKAFSNKTPKVTISAGVATYKGNGREKFIKEADANLYKAKETGKNKII